MKINEFMETIEPLSIENISISWNIYHNFENPPDETKIEGNFNIEVFPAESKKYEKNASGILEIKNPFPDIKFVNKDQNYSVIIPGHRLLTVSLEEEKVIFTFMPHGIKPIEGFSTEKHISWGKCSIDGDTDQKSKILKPLIQILFVSQKTPRSRCESCKGLKMLIGDSDSNNDSDSDSELFDHQLICHDCLQGAINFYKEFEIQIENLENRNNINQPREMLFQLIDGGIELADRLNNEKLNSEFLFFQALLMSKDEDPQIIQESLELLEEIIMFSSSWNYKKLNEKSEKLKSSILENNPDIKSIEEEVILENQDLIEDIDNPVQTGIKFLQKAKELEQQGNYQEAIDCIKKASAPLVDSGVWSAEDFHQAQQEITRLTNLISIKSPKPVEEVVPEPVEELVPEPVEEVVPEPVEEVVPEPVEEAVPEPVEELVPEPVEELVPEPVGEEIMPGSIEDIMKKMNKTNILNLKIEPVKAPKPIKIVDNSIPIKKPNKSKEISSIFPVETAEEKIEEKIKKLIEQQDSASRKVSINSIISSDKPSISINKQDSVESVKSNEITEKKVETKSSIVFEKAEKTSKRPSMGYNLFGVPNRVTKKNLSSTTRETEVQPRLTDISPIQKKTISKSRIRRRTSVKRTKTKIEICPMCGKLSCICGYMTRIKK